jgi:transcriptional regulator PpsR
LEPKVKHPSMSAMKTFEKSGTAVMGRPGSQVLAPDVILTLDIQGIIQEVSLANVVSGEEGTTWLGRSWVETVDEISSKKVLRMVSDATTTGVSAFRQVNQQFPGGTTLPMEYTVVRLSGEGGLLAIGRNLRAVAELQARLITAQQAVEQEYWKIREVESRYRHLFDGSNEAVLLIQGDTLDVLEANPSAMRSCGLSPGHDILQVIEADERDTFYAMLREAQRNGRAPAILLHMGPERDEWLVRASSLAGAAGQRFLVQLAPATGDVGTSALPTSDVSLSDLLGRLPDAFIVIDRMGLVQHVNRAFLDLVQVGSEGTVIGQQLTRWFSAPGADLPMLLSILRRHGSVRLFSTVIHGELGTETEVEVSAAYGSSGSQDHIALMLRDIGRRLERRDNGDDDGSGLHTVLADLMARGGKPSFSVLIKDTLGLVERYYINAALELAEGNRTAAAELLGLSRQSLYTKLEQYSIDAQPRLRAGPRR